MVASLLNLAAIDLPGILCLVPQSSHTTAEHFAPLATCVSNLMFKAINTAVKRAGLRDARITIIKTDCQKLFPRCLVQDLIHVLLRLFFRSSAVGLGTFKIHDLACDLVS